VPLDLSIAHQNQTQAGQAAVAEENYLPVPVRATHPTSHEENDSSVAQQAISERLLFHVLELTLRLIPMSAPP
jgi:hypothetical protein